MEIRIKVSVNNVQELEKKLEMIKHMEKEYNCNCTLLDVEIKH